MKTLVIVIAHPEAEPILQMNWPWLLKGGCDIAVVNHANCMNFALSPHPRFNLGIGGPPNSTPNRWVDRFIDVLNWYFTSVETTDYDGVLITESDSIFLRPVPGMGVDVAATLAGYHSEGFLAKQFYHAPWYFSNAGVQQFLRRARIMLSHRLTEQGFIDRFIGLYSDLYLDREHIKDLSAYGQAHTRNTVNETFLDEARRAAQNPLCFFMHGIKTPAVLAQVTEGL